MSKRKRSENGQSLMLVALLLVVFIGILALVFDGGYTYFMRRNAQNAADAGALAGARVYCDNLDAALGRETALNYVHENDALVYPNDSTTDIGISDNKVTVETVIEFNNFFGRIFGREKTEAVAHAVAGCFSPTLAEGVLPIIWFCNESITGELGDDPVCIEQFIDWTTLQDYLKTPHILQDELYIVMDNLDWGEGDIPCIEDDPNGYMVCDFDDDEFIDHFAGDARGWADLDGANNDNPPEINCKPKQEQTTELDYWITAGFECELETHTWVPVIKGDVTPLFQAIIDRIDHDTGKGPLVLLPVFNEDRRT